MLLHSSPQIAWPRQAGCAVLAEILGQRLDIRFAVPSSLRRTSVSKVAVVVHHRHRPSIRDTKASVRTANSSDGAIHRTVLTRAGHGSLLHQRSRDLRSTPMTNGSMPNDDGGCPEVQTRPQLVGVRPEAVSFCSRHLDRTTVLVAICGTVLGSTMAHVLPLVPFLKSRSVSNRYVGIGVAVIAPRRTRYQRCLMRSASVAIRKARRC